MWSLILAVIVCACSVSASTKNDLVAAVATQTGQPLDIVTKITDGYLQNIKNAIKMDEQVVFEGLGTFVLRKRAARMGRNIKTGKTVLIPASNDPAFKPAKSLVQAMTEASLKRNKREEELLDTIPAGYHPRYSSRY